MKLIEITDREKLILYAVIDNYIKTGETISSINIVARYKINLSSATIRNEMSYLQEIGFLKKPHVSSGRIPTNDGYKYYINYILKLKKVSSKVKKILEGLYDQKNANKNEVFLSTVNKLSEITNCIAFSLETKYFNIIENIKMIHVEKNSFVLVVIYKNKKTMTQHLNIEKELDENNLNKIEILINEKIKIETIKTMTDLVYVLKKELDCKNDDLKELLKTNKDKYYLAGLENIIEMIPDISSHEMIEITEMLRNERKSVNFFKEVHNHFKDSQDEIQIILGDEIGISYFKNLSLIIFGSSSNNSDFILGLITPKRINYQKAVSVMQYIVNEIKNFIQD